MTTIQHTAGMVVCPSCEGAGEFSERLDVDLYNVVKCETCDGEGWIEAEPDESAESRASGK